MTAAAAPTTPGPTPVLDEQICFALYNASRAVTARYRDLLAPLGLTYPQYLVLLVLWQGGPTTVSELGHQLQLESGTLSPLLKRLETHGLLTRTRSVVDERTVDVALTGAGVALREQAAGFADQICGATGLELTDLQTLRADIAALAAAVRANTAAVAAATPPRADQPH
ncbi:MarR family winged helix-turn-helix transcriptional regulator [Frigoribacterium sp. PhB24]|uniref:MarR family winged helix-turn-helix transcriptional regulator n=1 Tax=Frigoribacterium sp. PhB24 TaxID=2485204 RepID=UPI000F4940C7|nr:MarR family transcriptional regulator [Frigoribacterium sp. PhB24]ROS52693.1 MarR family transcriptional regulator [Frigoribacterium sp. PhB24]